MASPYLDRAIGAAGLTKMSMKYGTGKDMMTTYGSSLDNGMEIEGYRTAELGRGWDMVD